MLLEGALHFAGNGDIVFHFLLIDKLKDKLSIPFSVIGEEARYLYKRQGVGGRSVESLLQSVFYSNDQSRLAVTVKTPCPACRNVHDYPSGNPISIL